MVVRACRKVDLRIAVRKPLPEVRKRQSEFGDGDEVCEVFIDIDGMFDPKARARSGISDMTTGKKGR